MISVSFLSVLSLSYAFSFALALYHRCYQHSFVFAAKLIHRKSPSSIGRSIRCVNDFLLCFLRTSGYWSKWTMIVTLLFLSLIQLTVLTDSLNSYDPQLPGSSNEERNVSLSFGDLVIFNLIDVAPLIRHGWRLVTDTSNATLTEQTLGSVDLAERNRTNLTHLALRTPPAQQNQKRFLLPVQFNTESKNSSGTRIHFRSGIVMKRFGFSFYL